MQDIHGSLEELTLSLPSLVSLSNDVQVLQSVAQRLLQRQGKRTRPAVLLLLARALSGAENDAQSRLAQVTELIHAASLLHDDVIDGAEIRRAMPAAHVAFGNKKAVLGGDFLLARASVLLARLGNTEAVALMAEAIENLVQGEILQLLDIEHIVSPEILEFAKQEIRKVAEGEICKEARGDIVTLMEAMLQRYLEKSYLKTASLLAKSCKAVAVLGNCSRDEQDIAFEFGKHLGIMFQIVDDVLDFEGNAGNLGKPELLDLANGIASAPIIFAAQEFPELASMVLRKFQHENDTQIALKLLGESKGIARAKELAEQHAEAAVAAILQLPSSAYTSALVRFVDVSLHRKN